MKSPGSRFVGEKEKGQDPTVCGQLTVVLGAHCPVYACTVVLNLNRNRCQLASCRWFRAAVNAWRCLFLARSTLGGSWPKGFYSANSVVKLADCIL